MKMLFHVICGLLICQAFCSALPNQPVNPHQSRNIQEKILSIFNRIVPEKENPQDVVQADNQDNSISHGAEELPQGNRVNSNLQDSHHQEKKNRIKRATKLKIKPIKRYPVYTPHAKRSRASSNKALALLLAISFIIGFRN